MNIVVGISLFSITILGYIYIYIYQLYGSVHDTDLKCFQLKLRLTHIAAEKVKVSQFLDPHPSIIVDWIKPFVNLNLKQNIFSLCFFYQFLVFFQCFHHWLGSHYMQSFFKGGIHNCIMSVVGGEDRTNISRLCKSIKSL